MNNEPLDKDSQRTFQLMNEIATGEAISQRELASRLGIAVGLVNSYLKNLTAKGWIRIKNYPRNRYAYLLTPKGLAEKSRLAYQHLTYFNNLYTVVRQDYQGLFAELREQGYDQVVFCGVDEVAEIAYLSLQEVGLQLSAVFDELPGKKDFFGWAVAAIGDIRPNAAPIILTSLKRGDQLRQSLQSAGIEASLIYAPN